MNRIFFILFSIVSFQLAGQTIASSIHPSVTVKSIFKIRSQAVRIAQDPLSENLFYTISDGSVYMIRESNGIYSDTLLFTTAEHGVEYLMGMCFIDSILYLSGNNDIDLAFTTGLIVRGKMNASGIRQWDTVMTAVYQTAGAFDHMMSGFVADKKNKILYICNGARGDHGEVQSRQGQFPDLRNPPLTTKIFAIPASSKNLLLQNDSAWLANSGYLFASGARNFFDMAFAANDDLFALENSGDRDNSEEMNWLRKGHHYGFPWKLGGADNPQQYPGFNPNTDKMIPVNCYAKTTGAFHDDPDFPKFPSGLEFTEPIKNFGPDADKFRDPDNSQIYDAGDLGIYISSFTAHRSPLGLVFDTDSLLDDEFCGSGFMLSFNKGLPASKVYPPNNEIGPFLDPSEDLIHIKLEKDPSGNNYSIHCTRIIENLSSPVDAEIVGNRIYVIETKYGTPGNLYEVTIPEKKAAGKRREILVFPNPGTGVFRFEFPENIEITNLSIFNMHGQRILYKKISSKTDEADLINHPAGCYSFMAEYAGGTLFGKLILF